MALLEPVKPRRCTTGPVEPVNGINKDVCGAKLQPTSVSAYPVLLVPLTGHKVLLSVS